MAKGTQEQKKAKILKVLELQKQGIIYKSMSNKDCKDLLGYSKKTTLYNLMNREGYTYDKAQGIFIKPDQEVKQQQIDGQISIEDEYYISNTDETQEEQYTSNTDVVQKNEAEQYNSNTVILQNGIIDYLKDKDKAIKLFNLINRADDLIKLLDNETVVEESIRLTVDTEEELVQANFRMFKSVKEEFQAFCKKHKTYKTQELISQALKEFMEKYK